MLSSNHCIFKKDNSINIEFLINKQKSMARKRSNGGGAVKKLTSGNWRAQIMDGYRDNGKRNIISFTAKNKGEVLDIIRVYWNSKESAPKPEPNMISFREWADIWYLDYKTQVQPSTYCNYQYTLNILKNYFDCKPLVEIKPMHVNRFHDHLLSPACLNLISPNTDLC